MIVSAGSFDACPDCPHQKLAHTSTGKCTVPGCECNRAARKEYRVTAQVQVGAAVLQVWTIISATDEIDARRQLDAEFTNHTPHFIILSARLATDPQ